MRGRFITFEGGEGAGKSTQIQRLLQQLHGAGIKAVTTREPGGSPKAERIRESVLSGAAKPFGPLAEALMFSAARLDHLEQTIRPALARGEFVLCDRFADSTRAYQGTVGRIDAALIRALERAVVEDTRPDLTFVLDLPAEIGLARAAARRGAGTRADRFEGEDTGFHEALRQAFLDIARQEPDRCVVIDANREPGLVEADIWGVVQARLLPSRPTELAMAGGGHGGG
ncbi:MAG TPA: dTMP kinase [Beijerinckiaceae bacterium]